MFYGDSWSSNPVPLDFLKGRREKFKCWTDSKKVESVLNHLAINSEVEMWYDSLPAATKADWKKFKATFKLNWPRETVVKISIAEIIAKLTRE